MTKGESKDVSTDCVRLAGWLGFLQKQGSLQSKRGLLDEAWPEDTSQRRVQVHAALFDL